jgi:LCP family protein required for cell wall assembly
MALRNPHDRGGQPAAIDFISLLLVFGFLVIAGITGVGIFIVSRNISANMDAEVALPTPKPVEAIGTPAISPGIAATGLPGSGPAAAPTPPPWDGASRVNILVMGLDYRDWLAHDIPRSDTMILFTIDPLTKTAGMLSIQRDLWVNIPGFDYNKINVAYADGEASKLPGGGPVLASRTVEQFLGVPVDYYAVIDFDSFVKFIDDLGGLDMYIREPIKVDPIGPGNTITLQVGVQTLDGKTVLAYARNRYTQYDDFDRAKRQQEVIMAIRDQVVNLKMLPTLIVQAPKIYNDIASGIRTNLTLMQVIQLAVLAEQIPVTSIKKGVIGPPDQVAYDKSPTGLDILKPIPDKIRILRDEIFTANGPVSPAARASDLMSLVKTEQARIQIQNGTPNADLANRTAEYFKAQGINVVETTPVNQAYSSTSLIVYNGKPYTEKYLAQLMNITSANLTIHFDPNAQADLTVILGNNWAKNNPLP